MAEIELRLAEPAEQQQQRADAPLQLLEGIGRHVQILGIHAAHCWHVGLYDAIRGQRRGTKADHHPCQRFELGQAHIGFV